MLEAEIRSKVRDGMGEGTYLSRIMLSRSVRHFASFPVPISKIFYSFRLLRKPIFSKNVLFLNFNIVHDKPKPLGVGQYSHFGGPNILFQLLEGGGALKKVGDINDHTFLGICPP